MRGAEKTFPDYFWEDSGEEGYFMIRNKRVTVSAIYLSAFAGMFFITSRAVILPTVLKELQAENYYSVAVLMMSLFMCIVLPVAGKLSDIYGRKRIF